MIVTCHSCQTRFRVADEKIGPKGARVRCTRCKSVFAVRLPPSAGGAASRAPANGSAPAAPPVPAGAEVLPRGDDPFARAAAARSAGTIPDLALEDTERAPAPVSPAPEPTVASRAPLLDFGEVDLAGPDPFEDSRRASYLDLVRQEDAARVTPIPGLSTADDPLAGFSFGDLGAPPSSPAASALPPPVEVAPLAAAPAAAGAPPAAAPRDDGASPDAEGDAAADAERSRRRLRAVGLNALSLVALLVAAVVLFDIWRARQHHEPGGAAAPAVAIDVSSAPYETAAGRPVVVVRGKVRAAEPLRSAEVQVELLDGGRPVAKGRALAGAVPTVEEVHAVTSGEDAERLVQELAGRAPERIAAGEVLPFAAVVADPPPDLHALEVRVSVRPDAGSAP